MSAVVVVAAAITTADRRWLLAAQRSRPARLAGMWELPGGKVEPGESEPDALRRECREELGVELELGEPLSGGAVAISDVALLKVWWATVAAGEPVALEHAALRWLARDQLDEVRWLPADLPVVELIRHSLRR